MKIHIKVFFFCFISFSLLVGCSLGSNENSSDDARYLNSGENAEEQTEAGVEGKIDQEKKGPDGKVTLPKDFPSDFPLPKDITITEVRDKSDEKRYSYSIQFDFDPNIDLEATFEMYQNYAESLDYIVVIGGEEYFAEGIFQYGATDSTSINNMFIVTIKPENAAYGSIELKVEK